MTIQASVQGAGISSLATQAIVGGSTQGVVVTSAMTTQATGIKLTGSNTEFTSVASGGATVLRANLSPGDNQFVFNFGGNALLVFPPVGESINALSANASFSIADGGKAQFKKISNTRWASIVSA